MNTAPSRNGLLGGGVCLLIALALTATGRAASISWSMPMNIAHSAIETDVVNSGTLLGAFNLGTTAVPSTTVNGVLFSPFAIPSPGGVNAYTVGHFTLGFTQLRHQYADGLGQHAIPVLNCIVSNAAPVCGRSQ